MFIGEVSKFYPSARRTFGLRPPGLLNALRAHYFKGGWSDIKSDKICIIHDFWEITWINPYVCREFPHIPKGRSGAPRPTTGLSRHLRWLAMFMQKNSAGKLGHEQLRISGRKSWISRACCRCWAWMIAHFSSLAMPFQMRYYSPPTVWG